MAFKVEITATHVIKPSSPTPPHLKSFKLSLIDQNIPSVHIPIIFFYKQNQSAKTNLTITLELKASLSQVLTRFYPFAGRINGSVSAVECNDDGVPFFEAFVPHSTLSDILKKPDLKMMRQLVPPTEESNTIPLLIQASFFEGGGMAIGVCFSHTNADASTFCTFIREWSNTCLGNQPVVNPDFSISSLFPAVDSLNSGTITNVPKNTGLVLKRFVFNASSISALKAQLAYPCTRVQAISALIWKCAINASKSTPSSSKINSSLLIHAVNIRRMLEPPLPENSVGTVAVVFWAQQNYEEDNEVELNGLVDKVRNGFKEFCDDFRKEVNGSEGSNAILKLFKEVGDAFGRDGMESYTFTSWCGFRFYEADYGWGKPEWISNINSLYKNNFCLMDAKDGDGIEVWVNLEEAHMSVFERDQELLAFSCVDPSII